MGGVGFKLSAPQEYILTSTKEINLFLAGVGSGKTHLGGLISGGYIQKFPHIRGFIGANTYNQLNTSTMLRIREVWKELFNWEADRDYVVGKQPPKGFSMEGHNFDRYDGIVSFKNGAIVFIGSLDNAKAHDGKEFGWAILDETKDTREQDVKEVILTRMRQTGMDFQGRGFNPLYILTSPAKVQWLNEWFELDEYRAEIEGSIYSENTFFAKEQKNKCIAISSTYHNQINLPEGYIDRIKDNNPDERAKALIYANPFTKTGGEFYSSFSAARHVGRVEYKPELPIHISFDQNVVPYITATLWQVEQSEKGWDLRNFDEFCLPNPNNTSERLCEAIIAKYGDRCKSMFFYGDASGNFGSTKSPETDYQIVSRVLRKWLHHGSDRTERRNPPVIKRRDFINNIFEGKTRWRILIDEACKKMVVDMTYIKQDPNGKKWKEKAKDEISGQTYEKYGHCFVGETLITTSEGQKRIDSVLPGDMVLTREGFRKVQRVFDNGIKAVNRYEIGGVRITCTKDHHFYTSEHGFIPVEKLKIGQTICIFDENKSRICKKKLYFLTDSSLTDTPNRKGQATAFIFRDGLRLMESERRSGSINMSGFSKTGQYLKGITYTIWTKIQATTSRITWNANWALSTLANTGRRHGQPIEMRNSESLMRLREWRQASGMARMMAGSGTDNTPEIFMRLTGRTLHVSSAELLKIPGMPEQNSALLLAKTGITPGLTERRGNTMKTGFVSAASAHSALTNGARQEIAPDRVRQKLERVYDLQVEGEHEYFANGILVHNCSDSMDYMICEVAASDFERFCEG